MTIEKMIDFIETYCVLIAIIIPFGTFGIIFHLIGIPYYLILFFFFVVLLLSINFALLAVNDYKKQMKRLRELKETIKEPVWITDENLAHFEDFEKTIIENNISFPEN